MQHLICHFAILQFRNNGHCKVLLINSKKVIFLSPKQFLIYAYFKHMHNKVEILQDNIS